MHSLPYSLTTSPSYEQVANMTQLDAASLRPKESSFSALIGASYYHCKRPILSNPGSKSVLRSSYGARELYSCSNEPVFFW